MVSKGDGLGFLAHHTTFWTSHGTEEIKRPSHRRFNSIFYMKQLVQVFQKHLEKDEME